MASATFNPGLDSGTNVAATANCPRREHQLMGEVHDGATHALGGVSGNAGLFSNCADPSRFCRAVALRNEGKRSTLFGSAVINLMFENALSESASEQTIGWFAYPNDMLPGGDFVSKAANGHSGFTGTALIIDPNYELTAVFLTNRVCSDDDGTRFRHLRKRIFNAVVGSIMR